ncbi:hypothetical protein [Methylobacterium sp. ID0610]
MVGAASETAATAFRVAVAAEELARYSGERGREVSALLSGVTAA